MNLKLKYFFDTINYKKILCLQNKHKKDYFDKDGCGLEIEFGVNYSHFSRVYIRTGLQKLRDCVGDCGKFVTDNTIGCDMNFEIVLNPMAKDELKKKMFCINEIINYYENFEFNERCGVHANFRADDNLKEMFYNELVLGGYRSEMYTHNKYKVDFFEIAKRPSGYMLSYDEYVKHQKMISAKYTAVNFLKKNLIEFRALNLNWDSIEYTIDLFEKVKKRYESENIEE